MSTAVEKFLRYVTFDTESDPASDTTPSTEKQFALGRLLVEELKAMGVSDARIDEKCYVYGSIPATCEGAPTLGFIAHMDTACGVSGKDVTPRIEKAYAGGPVRVNDSLSILPEQCPGMERCIGQDLIVTDGSTLLGADDKAGVAEIMTMAEYLIAHPELAHGRICIGFTPDEEIGRGADFFDVAGFGADFAYTVDGGPLGEIEYENFNAASAVITIEGCEVHPGSAKGVMVNAVHLAEEFDSLLPVFERPEHTEGYEGFFHLQELHATEGSAIMGYIIRDHDKAKFERKKDLIRAAGDFMNVKYNGRFTVTVKDSYSNMKEMILPHMHLIDTAAAAFADCGVASSLVPIRGGTDGARLSYEGLPCPNLSTGGYNFHGRLEFIPAQSLLKMAEVLIRIALRTAEKTK